MTTTTSFKPGIDLPQWRPNSPPTVIDAAGACMAWDMRNDNSRTPLIYSWRSQNQVDSYNPITDDWGTATNNLGMSGFGAGGACVMHPSQGPRGTLAAGSTTTSVVISTAFLFTVQPGQLANRGDGVGYRIRIIGKSAGGSGKINERTIISNTSGTSPTIMLDVPLDWTPALGDGYELLSGRIYFISPSTLSFKSLDIPTSVASVLSVTNLVNGGIDTTMLAFSELHVSCDRQPGTGFLFGGSSYDPAGTGLNGALATAKNCIVATASSSTTLTGSGMPTDLQTNEYTNFQVRIVEDTTNPTGVGQRAKITSHTSGATGVFTVGAWPIITPSTTAKFVIENNDDLIIASSGGSIVYTYSISANTWSTSTFGNSSNTGAGECFAQAFGIVRDPNHIRRHSHVLTVIGGGSGSINILDIAASSTGVWSGNMYPGFGLATITLGIGACGAYDPVTLGGKYFHLNLNGTQRMIRLNLVSTAWESGTYFRYPTATGAVVGAKLAFNYLIDGMTKLGILHQKINQTSAFISQIIQF